MFKYHFGIEIELTGITRTTAANTVASCTAGSIIRRHVGRGDTFEIQDSKQRIWKVTYDGSIFCQMRNSLPGIHSTHSEYSVEVVSPILTYDEDIETIQNLVRGLRKAGGFTNSTCGIHIHLDGADHTPRSILNFINLVASRNDLFYKALQIKTDRMKYCKKMDAHLVENANKIKPLTLEALKEAWYKGYRENIAQHYHSSRYHFLNLHSFFTGNHTVELRGFNSTLHAGKVRAYIVFALALDNQAITQKYAKYHKVQAENEKFAMRVYLNRIGLTGDEFKNCRMHLYEHLSGNAAWRYGSRANCRSHRAPHIAENTTISGGISNVQT